MNDRMTEMRRNDDSPLRELQRARRSGKAPRGAGHGNAFTPVPAHPDDMIVRAVSLAVEDLVARLVAAREAERDARAAQTVPRRLCFSGWMLDASGRPRSRGRPSTLRSSITHATSFRWCNPSRSSCKSTRRSRATARDRHTRTAPAPRIASDI